MSFDFVLFNFYAIIIERFSLFDDDFGCLFLCRLGDEYL